MLRNMQLKISLILIVGLGFELAQARAEVRVGLGGQVVVCLTPRGPINMSLASFENSPEATTSVGGSSEAEAFENLLKRLAIVNRTRAEIFRKNYQTFESRVKRLPQVTLVNPIDWEEAKVPGNCRVEKILLWRPDVLPGDKEFLLDQTHWEQLSFTTRAAILLEAFLFEERRQVESKDKIMTLADIRKMVAYVLTKPSLDTLAEYLQLTRKAGFKSFDLFGAEIDERIFSDYNSHYPFSEGAFLAKKESQILIRGEYKKIVPSGIVDHWPYFQRPDIKFSYKDGKITLVSVYLVDSSIELANGKKVPLYGLTSFYANGSPYRSELAQETELEARGPSGESIKIICVVGPREHQFEPTITFQEDGSVYKCRVKAGTYITKNKFITSHSFVTFDYRSGELSLKDVSYFDTEKKKGTFRLKHRLVPIDMYERNHNPNQWGDVKIRAYVERWEEGRNGLHYTTYDRHEMYVYDEGYPVESTLPEYPYKDPFTNLIFAPNKRCSFLSSQRIDGKIKWYRPQYNENTQRVAIGTLAEDARLRWASGTPKEGQGIDLKAGTRVYLDLQGHLLKYEKVCR